MKAAKNGAVYNVPIEIGSNYFVAKFDTGAGVTVISSDLFLDDKSDEAPLCLPLKDWIQNYPAWDWIKFVFIRDLSFAKKKFIKT